MTDIDGNPNFDRSFELGISFPSFIQLEIASSTSRLEYLAFFVFKTFIFSSFTNFSNPPYLLNIVEGEYLIYFL